MSDNLPPNPTQPLVMVNNLLRFKSNKIVELLLDTHPVLDMNALSRLQFSDEDRKQFAQLIGYSAFGYKTLSYVDDEERNKIDDLGKGNNV
jgi:hypothetical protein